MPVQWDIVVLTAGNSKQKKAFELQISAEHKQHFKEHYVVRDHPPGVKIGSGGATLNALLFLHNIHGDVLFEKKILVLHSGGYSQRLPHVAALGKLFMLMPSGKTLFEHKLQSYTFLLQNLPPGVFVASADTLEYFNQENLDLSTLKPQSILLIGHESDVNTALGHGVYVLNDGLQLEMVLQKPGLQLLQERVGSKIMITDSCYLLPACLLKEIIQARKANGDNDLIT